MRFLIASLALLTAGTAIAAEPAAPIRTVRDAGRVFHYTATKNADGSILLAGEEATTRAPFAFTVRGARVEGTMDGQRVAFDTPRRARLAIREQMGD